MGGNGLSMLLIPRGEGVETKLIKTAYSTTAGTAYITFDNVKVPAENLLGKEGKGLFVVLPSPSLPLSPLLSVSPAFAVPRFPLLPRRRLLRSLLPPPRGRVR